MNWLGELEKRIVDKTVKISIVGLGYVGLNLACVFAKNGFLVYGFDIDRRKVEKLRAGENYIFEEEWIKAVIKDFKNFMHFSIDIEDAAKYGDIIIIAVPTPLLKNKITDLNFVLSALDSIVGSSIAGKLLIIESSLPPGTTERVLKPRIESKTGFLAGKDFGLVFSPERIDPGNKKWRIWDIPKIVGGVDKNSMKLAVLLYSQVVEKVISVSSLSAAEMVKVMENTQRDVNIALTNLFALIAEKLGLDIEELLDAAATKWNFMRLKPSCGVGGDCIGPVCQMLIETAEKQGIDAQLLKKAREINEYMPQHLVQKAVDALEKEGKKIENTKITILGLAYKANSADTRNSPSLKIIDRLQKLGAEEMIAFDPYVRVEIKGVMQADSIEDAIADSDCIIIATDHDIFRNLNPPQAIIIDGRNILSSKICDKYYGIGR